MLSRTLFLALAAVGCLVLVAIPQSMAVAGDDPPSVAVVYGEHSYASAPNGEGRSARTFMNTVTKALDAVGIDYAQLKDSDVEAGKLGNFKVAIFPYNFVLPDREIRAIEDYVRRGGKIIVFYTLYDDIANLLGIKKLGFRQEAYGFFAQIVFKKDTIIGLPDFIRQRSWNITQVQPAAATTRIIGEWADGTGKPLGEPAVLLSSHGAFMGHILTSGDYGNKGRFLLCVIGHFAPEISRQACERAIASIPAVGPLKTFDELKQRIKSANISWWQRQSARSHLKNAMKFEAAAAWYAKNDLPGLCIDAAQKARKEAIRAYVLSATERRNELRAVWIHTAYGVSDWGWKRSIQHLRDCGFNGIFVNMLWAGLAHYPSKLLPVSPKVKKQGDQIAECLKWCKHYGVQLHVWKVNYNLSTAPDEFVEKLRKEGRLQKDRNGKEIRWLCPSDPRNFELERDSMLEVVRNYDIAGIHFDYIRYPGEQGCYCEGCRRRFEQATGVKVDHWPDDVLRPPLRAKFMKWRQDQITRLVRAVSTEARRIRPGIMISAAVFGNWSSSRYTVGQDWVRWIHEGLLDFVCPMDYNADASSFESLVRRQVRWVNGKVPLYPGIGAWLIGDTAGLVDQIERARRLGADGFTCFHYNDREFTDVRMPLLHKSITAHRTQPPHPAPRVIFTFPKGIQETDELAFREGAKIPVLIKLEPKGHYAKPIRAASGKIVVETTDGQMVRRLGRIAGGSSKPFAAAISMPAGRYRLVVRGTVRFGWFDSKRFIVRSRPFNVLQRAEAEELLSRNKPPEFKTKNIHVGVITGGYGSTALLQVLQEAEGVEAVPIYHIRGDILSACQVVVFPQRRDAYEITEAKLKVLRDFVKKGGGLIATHDAPGFRNHPKLIDVVCRGGSDRVDGSTWEVVAPHPVTKGIPVKKALPQSYYDWIALDPGPKGIVVANGIGKNNKTAPVIICGEYGSGRYVACGLALGIDNRSREKEPKGPERTFLINAVRWLAKQ